MIIKYHARFMYENRYYITYNVETLDGKQLTVETTTRFKGKTFDDLLKKLNTAAAGAMLTRKRWGNKFQSKKKFHYVWDGDASEFDETILAQAPVNLPLNEIKSDVETQELFEVVKVNGVWTIKKHESELMTWEDACAMLAYKITQEIKG